MSGSCAAIQSNYPLSVVIPTLGGKSIRETIQHLNRGTLSPAEILVCIPEDEAYKLETLLFPNVTLIKTKCRGQVAQRARGFQLAHNPLVLQLDDDILVRDDCLQKLADFIMPYPHASVGPAFYDLATGRYRSHLVRASQKKTAFDTLLFWIINGPKGYQPGQIGISGVNIGVPQTPDDWHDLGWLPGGCVLHRREHLILFNFYPFEGKAHAEDLFHSLLLRQRGVRLLRCGSAICDIEFTSSSLRNLITVARDYVKYAKRMTIFAKTMRGSVTRLYCFLLLNIVRIAINHVTARRTDV